MDIGEKRKKKIKIDKGRQQKREKKTKRDGE